MRDALGAAFVLLGISSAALAQEAPPSDMELMQRQTIAAIAEVNYLRGLIARREHDAAADKAASEARLSTAMDWLKTAQAGTAPK